MSNEGLGTPRRGVTTPVDKPPLKEAVLISDRESIVAIKKARLGTNVDTRGYMDAMVGSGRGRCVMPRETEPVGRVKPTLGKLVKCPQCDLTFQQLICFTTTILLPVRIFSSKLN